MCEVEKESLTVKESLFKQDTAVAVIHCCPLPFVACMRLFYLALC
jgi:hypothetical protein